MQPQTQQTKVLCTMVGNALASHTSVGSGYHFPLAKLSHCLPVCIPYAKTLLSNFLVNMYILRRTLKKIGLHQQFSSFERLVSR